MTDENLYAYLDVLRAAGWRVELTSEGGTTLNESFTLRHPRIPADYRKFLERVKFCANADETVWFLCGDDYNGTSEFDWAWNEMEKISLEGAEGNQEKTARVVEFWNRHLPFMYSVGGDYAYLAFRTTGEAFGSVVDGYDIELTEVTDVARSFEEFMILHSAAVRGESNELQDYV
ncbi:MAG TPA: SMI1/KNR4 family protein [Pyrinomonadaceae bacterium]|nr:SMI1/KNR4 family protein [Pyrinomonadaceae bacterium]